MALTTVANTNTFFEWLTRTNQLVTLINTLTEGNAATTGTITVSNPGFWNGNASINVTNGFYRGDGGMLSNIRLHALVSNTVTVTSNTKHITVVGTGVLGSTVFLNTANLSNSIADQSTANIASANSVWQVGQTAASAYTNANGAFGGANAAATSATNADTKAAAAFDQANTATTDAANARAHANSAYATANLASGGGAAFDRANLANGTANTALATAIAAFGSGNSTITIVSGVFDRANLANLNANNARITADSAYGAANNAQADASAAFGRANSAVTNAAAARAHANAAYAQANTGASGPAYDRANTDFFGVFFTGQLGDLGTERVLTYAPYGLIIDAIAYRVASGAVTIQVRKNGITNLTNASALAATTSVKSNNVTGNGSLAKGDYLELLFTNNTSADFNLEMTFMVTKTQTN